MRLNGAVTQKAVCPIYDIGSFSTVRDGKYLDQLSNYPTIKKGSVL
jgi:hypothetical protein